ncbi:MAG TPA: ATP-binding cassette domain-containing protein [Candidatus Scybalousia intestinigallinarum]|jgi:energy-coupling factor transport system ATP-binding protein|nr:ATP-binding cassette domain-containing protein [Candidatus Scybalousia intestinigallinarum]
MSKILEINNLTFSYPEKPLFRGLSLEIEEGKYITIVGNNKSGKTTLMKLICGILNSKESIVAGYAYVNHARIHDNSRFFGVVFSGIDNKFLFDNVYKEMAFPLENLNIPVPKIEEKILEVAKEFGITKFLDRKIENLTNSEKQELLIAIALLHDPKVLLLDNAFSMMNKKTKQKIEKILIERIERDKLTVILTTTNLNEIISSDYTYVLNNGDIIMEGKPSSILREEKILNRIGLELPFMIDLSLKLEFYELLDDEITDMDRMVDTLWK